MNTHGIDTTDRQLIRELAERYCFAIDVRNWAMLESCFAPDVSLSLHDGAKRFKGSRDAVEGLKSVALRTATHHAISNLGLSAEGGTVKGVIHSVVHLFVAGSDLGKVLMRGLRYEDEYVRSEQGWKIAKRAHIPIWQADLDTVPPNAMAGRSAST